MNTNHTPGPWIISPDDGAITDRSDCAVARVAGNRSRFEARANALLIASAPELLNFIEAIAGCVRVQDSDHPHHTSHLPAVIDGWIDHARTLTAKALGQSIPTPAVSDNLNQPL